MDWDKVRVFHAVAEAGSFTHAGEALNLSQSSVSRQISALEISLNAPLFHRHARGLKLTLSGETLYRTAQEVAATKRLIPARRSFGMGLGFACRKAVMASSPLIVCRACSQASRSAR